MFRKYSKEENIKTASAVRSSEQRSIRALVLQQYPALEPYIEDIFPKKASLIVCKWCARDGSSPVERGSPSLTCTHGQPTKSSHPCVLRVHHLSKDYVSILLDPNGEFIFFQCRQGPYIPTLRFLHRCA